MTAERRPATVRRSQVKALVLNALGRGFGFENIDIAMPVGREVLVDVKASGLCHTDLLLATHDIGKRPEFPSGMSVGARTNMSPWLLQRKRALDDRFAVGERCRRSAG
jgi:hypothetical protein